MDQALAVPDEDDYPSTQQWTLQKLSPTHQQVAALVAQGMKLVDIAPIVSLTPAYISLLLRQPIFKQFVSEKCEAAGTRMEALFEQSVEVLADTLKNGSEGGKLKAARLQLEATKRIGRNEQPSTDGAGAVDRLERLASRLIQLNTPTTLTEPALPILDAEFTERG